MIRACMFGGLGGIAIGAFGHGLNTIVHGNVSAWTISWTVAGALGMAALALWVYRVKRRLRQQNEVESSDRDDRGETI
jgi:uncharacterized membrane protein